MQLLYQHIVVGGTFDHFHAGHQKLLATAFANSKKVMIGVSTPNLHKNKLLADAIEDDTAREKSVRDYLQKNNFEDRATIVPLNNIFGRTLQEDIEAIVVTEENVPNVTLINTKRREQGFKPLHTIIVPYVLGSDGQKITSERIRKGEIDREGFVYKSLFETKQALMLPENLREQLHRPIGTVVKNTEDVLRLLEEKTVVIAVGDIISLSLQEASYTPAISIIDFKTRRHTIERKGAKLNHPPGVIAENPHGRIQKTAVDVYQTALKKYIKTGEKQTIIITGEEDLLALPAILLSPLGSIVLYGQFDQGVVINEVTEELKKHVAELVSKFDSVLK